MVEVQDKDNSPVGDRLQARVFTCTEQRGDKSGLLRGVQLEYPIITFG